jgi:DNA uptake protein ComE-like DNA-binding protein
LSVDSVSIRKINVNTASVEKLKSHPYLNFYQAKSLYEYRRKKRRVSKLSELNRLEEFNAETVEKIEPYLDFK